MDKLKELVLKAIGEGSMQWHETPKSVFDSEGAEKVGDKLMKDVVDWHKAEVKRDVKKALNDVKDEWLTTNEYIVDLLENKISELDK